MRKIMRVGLQPDGEVFTFLMYDKLSILVGSIFSFLYSLFSFSMYDKFSILVGSSIET